MALIGASPGPRFSPGVCGWLAMAAAAAFVTLEEGNAGAGGRVGEGGPAALEAIAQLTTGRPSAVGAFAGLALLFAPTGLEEQLLAGPRLSVLWARGEDRTRLDLNAGVESTLWLVNAIGPGMAFDVVARGAITGESSSVFFRVEPNLTVRLKRWKEEGAWALRIGIPYNTHYKWGFQAGITLQFSRVPLLGEEL